MTIRRINLSPYLLALPGAAWLAVFFLLPISRQVVTSLSEGSIDDGGMNFTWHWQNYLDAAQQFAPWFIRSFEYAAIGTGLAILIGYPLAYFIVFRGGKYRTILLFPVIVPFLITYLVRTVSWQALLADDGIILGTMKHLGMLPDGAYVLGTTTAVVFALAYNFLPFAVLPIYVSLDRIDPALLRAAADLYANPLTTFRRIVLPLSLPGVFAGSILTFIPAAGDFVNAMMLGSPQRQMIGNVIQSRYLVTLDYPLAAAASLALMFLMIVAVTLYARLFGTEGLTG